jgi:hypothetical protein
MFHLKVDATKSEADSLSPQSLEYQAREISDGAQFFVAAYQKLHIFPLETLNDCS